MGKFAKPACAGYGQPAQADFVAAGAVSTAGYLCLNHGCRVIYDHRGLRDFTDGNSVATTVCTLRGNLYAKDPRVPGHACG
jgi:hypothetical protein